ncbi:MAG: helix-turn-helix domain-containing protein [Chloroflexota bacterium]|nr:helix-turn-helix domain-containing protein [Chloroflexota bacterium]
MLNRQHALSRERLAAAMARQGVTQQVLGEHIGYSLDSDQPTISKILSGRAQPSLEKLIQIAMYLNTSLDYLLELTDTPRRPQGADPGEASDVACVQAHTEPPPAGLTEFSTVLPAEGSQPFRCREFLKTYGIDLKRARVFHVVGDSMMPTLPHGSTILVDCTRAVPLENRLYVFKNDGDILVKRARQFPVGTWWWCSDHPLGGRMEQTDEDDVWGEVRWVGHAIIDGLGYGPSSAERND